MVMEVVSDNKLTYPFINQLLEVHIMKTFIKMKDVSVKFKPKDYKHVI